jgi:hypothetical protein
MSVAQVLNVSGITPTGQGPPADDERIKVVKALDGLEHIYTLGNTGTGAGMTIIVWRDKAAMEAGAAQQQKSRSEVQQDLGVSIRTSAVYDTFTEL